MASIPTPFVNTPNASIRGPVLVCFVAVPILHHAYLLPVPIESGRTSATALATGPTHKPQAGANQRKTNYYLRFGGDFGGAGGSDRSTGVNCCASQASIITDWRVPL